MWASECGLGLTLNPIGGLTRGSIFWKHVCFATFLRNIPRFNGWRSPCFRKHVSGAMKKPRALSASRSPSSSASSTMLRQQTSLPARRECVPSGRYAASSSQQSCCHCNNTAAFLRARHVECQRARARATLARTARLTVDLELQICRRSALPFPASKELSHGWLPRDDILHSG